MKIITPGQIPENRTYRATCRRCQCEFEFVETEARKVYDWRDHAYFAIACPTCKHEVTVVASNGH